MPQDSTAPADGAMSEDRFWELVDGTARDDTDEQADLVTGRLERLSSDELAAYEQRLTSVAGALLTWEHRGAAEVILGMVSEDAFRNFRYWVVFRGRAVYEAFRADPDTLAEHGPEDDEQIGAAEVLEYAAHEVYRDKTSQDLADLPDAPEYTDELTGERIDESNRALAARYPRLAARYMRGVDPRGTNGGAPRPITAG